MSRKDTGGSILVVEDEPAILEMIAVNLEHAGYRVHRALDVAQAKAAMGEALPSLILLDWMLPDMPGLEFSRQLRAHSRTREIPIIMLTARAGEEDKIRGLDSGADDYVTKPFSPRELMARIKAVMRRRAPQHTDDVAESAGLELDPVAHRVKVHGKALELAPAEFRLLRFLMTHPERVYSRAQLLDSIWGDHVFVEERTVDVNVRRLRQALEPSGHDSLIETVRGTGYRFRGALE